MEGVRGGMGEKPKISFLPQIAIIKEYTNFISQTIDHKNF